MKETLKKKDQIQNPQKSTERTPWLFGLEIKDLVNDDGSAIGTEVILTLPNYLQNN